MCPKCRGRCTQQFHHLGIDPLSRCNYIGSWFCLHKYHIKREGNQLHIFWYFPQRSSKHHPRSRTSGHIFWLWSWWDVWRHSSRMGTQIRMSRLCCRCKDPYSLMNWILARGSNPDILGRCYLWIYRFHWRRLAHICGFAHLPNMLGTMGTFPHIYEFELQLCCRLRHTHHLDIQRHKSLC